MHAYFGILSILLLVTFTNAQTKKSGEDIADALYKHPNECKDPNDGGIWAPLAAGQSCGEHDCKYPDEWCSARSSSRSVPQFNCVKLSEDCKRALAKDDGQEYKPSTDKPSTKTAQSASPKSTLKPSTSTKAGSGASKSTLKPTKSASSTTLKPKSVTGSHSENSEKSVTKSTTQADVSEVTTVEAKTELTTPGGSSEEIETTVRTRRPNRFRGRPGEEKPRKEEKEGGAGSEVAPSTQKPADDCKDSSPLCCFWASNIHSLGSECDRNALWMRVNCQKSCGTCGCQVSNFQTCSVKVNTEGCPFLQGSNSNLVFVPVQSQGGPFSFPTAGGAAGNVGNGGNVQVPIGNGFNGGFAQSQPNPTFQIQNPNPSFRLEQGQRVAVPLGAGKR